MAGHGEKLSRNQEKAIGALLTNASIPEAAKEVGIGERTLWRWMKIDGFKEAYRQAKAQVVNHAIAKVQKSMGEAVETLKGIMKDPEAPSSARVSAAKAIIDMGIKATEIEQLEERINILEKQLKIGG